jgi:threonylcarbamoyladenosine tRNA methylthiotransferase MtaB
LGQEEQVLLEHPDRGHTEYFAPLRLLGSAGQPGEIRRLRVTGADADGLVAEAA